MKRVIDVDAELNKLESKIGNMSIQPATLFDIHFIKDCLISNNSISEALVELRKYLCTCNSSAIDMVLHLGILETLWNLTKSLVDKDVYEICWILTNLSAGNEQQTEILVNNGIIELMSQLLTSTSDEVVVQAAWCLGNISGDQKDYRERIMVNLSSYNGLSFFMSRKSMQSEFPLKVFAWVLSNLCRLQPSNEYWGFIVIDLQVCIYNLDIFNCNDEQTIIDFCWALTRCLHSVESLHRKQLVNAALVDGIFGVVSRFNRPNVLIPVFRVLTNIVAGDDQETFHVVANDKIEVIVGFLNVKNNPLLKECLMCLSNIAASNTHGSKLHHSTILLQILSMLQSENTDVVKLECLWILSNCSSMNEVLLHDLLQQNYFETLLDCINYPKLVKKSLDALYFIEICSESTYALLQPHIMKLAQLLYGINNENSNIRHRIHGLLNSIKKRSLKKDSLYQIEDELCKMAIE